MKAPIESFSFSPVFNDRGLGREIGNFGTDQLSDMGRTQRYVSCITKTRLYNFDPLKPHFYIVKLGFRGVYIICLISA